ncbi:S-adenosyl-L-methionine-dependent methyltransferase [Lasiosphaeria hispida]|uniref:S-adenosyl-L-methionine-dependent methyltransferase n=1 Tax=Lasiosphaeria hispida TaxID=260671 RepID=A0AAJ0H8N2_9PEZI|nr:S-adenosyl-L-methionine-dependent methyltransferase [Lasiosphaeria hispida]
MTSLPSSSAAPAVAKLAAAAAAPGHDAQAEVEAEAYERTHVHGVYEAIAPHFSATRHKPWPAVASFLQAQHPGSVGLDVGCGNGKYLRENPAVFMLGSDRSAALVALARSRLGRSDEVGGAQQQPAAKKRGETTKPDVAVAAATTTNAAAGSGMEFSHEGGAAISDVLVADGLSLPFRDRAVGFAICVAVVHHLSTRARRQEAIRQLLRCVKTGEAASGQVLVYVWALEQGNSRRGWDEGGEQDLLVPWVLKSKSQTQQSRTPRKGLDNQTKAEQDAVVANKSGEPPASTMPAGDGPAAGTGGVGHTDPVFQRYYHLYRKGELEEDVLAAGGVVITSGYERDNWWAVAANEAPPSQPEK